MGWPNDDLESTSYAVYLVNQFCMRMRRDVRIIDDHDERVSDPLPSHQAVFVHEYIHYLHNVSTVAGFKSFAIWQRLLAAFSDTLNDDGSSRGGADLEPDVAALVRECLAILNATHGDRRPALKEDSRIHEFKVVDVVCQDAQLPLQGGATKLSTVTATCRVRYRDSEVLDHLFRVGTLAIYEGIAHEIGCMVALGPRGDGADLDPTTPLFPYQVLREVGLHLVPELERIALLICAVLALNTTDPPRRLVEMLRRYGELRGAGRTLKHAIAVVDAETALERRGATRAIVEGDLPLLEKMHEGRGLSPTSMRLLAQIFETLLNARLQNPVYELRPFMNQRADMLALNRLLRTVAPCDLIQERDGEPEKARRDALYTFSPHRTGCGGFSVSELLRTLHAQTDFVAAHLQPNGFAPSSTHRCPFFESCTLRLREESPEVCASRPWSHVTRRETCWYGAAVAATRGLVRVTMLPTDGGFVRRVWYQVKRRVCTVVEPLISGLERWKRGIARP